MKNRKSLLLCALVLFSLVLLWSVVPVLGQAAADPPVTADAATAAPLPVVIDPMADAPTWIVQLATQYPKIAIVIAVIGALRLLVKPVVATAHSIANALGKPKDDEWITKVENSKTYQTVLFVLDWIASIKFRR